MARRSQQLSHPPTHLACADDANNLHGTIPLINSADDV
jgi:hypothetical protein